MFIDSNFKMVDLNDDGIIAAEEYRFNCITKFAIEDIETVDEAFNNLLNVSELNIGLPQARYNLIDLSKCRSRVVGKGAVQLSIMFPITSVKFSIN